MLGDSGKVQGATCVVPGEEEGWRKGREVVG